VAAESFEVVVVGAGQAGLAMSAQLRAHNIDHVLLERHRIAERWRSERWDSLVANGPAWHDAFPGYAFPGDQEGFPSKQVIVEYLESIAGQISSPVRCGVEVIEVTRHVGRKGFRVVTSHGEIDAGYVVVATGAFQVPVLPQTIPQDAPVTQLHSSAYRNPDHLPAGAVMVIGSGSSGAQIADDLRMAGRQVYLSIGGHHRPPRRYRGRDYVWWLGVLNKWDAETVPGAKHTTIAVSGVDGGKTIDFRTLAYQGVTLTGSTVGYGDGTLRFADDLGTHLAAGDADYLSVLREADEFIIANNLDLPLEPGAWVIPDDPACVREPRTHLHLADAGVSTVLWATGYRRDFSWLQTAAADEHGQPVHRRGVSAEPGIYFLGLPWQTRRGSSFIWGVWYDAKYITDHLVKQRDYLAYQPGPVAGSAVRTET
jgi:putative flavoprotein involved in K+ transport